MKIDMLPWEVEDYQTIMAHGNGDEVRETEVTVYRVIDSKGHAICDLGDTLGDTSSNLVNEEQDELGTYYAWDEAGRVHAHLIAAAPELLAVCRAFMSDHEDTFVHPDDMTGESKDLYVQCKEAIAKATGARHP